MTDRSNTTQDRESRDPRGPSGPRDPRPSDLTDARDAATHRAQQRMLAGDDPTPQDARHPERRAGFANDPEVPGQDIPALHEPIARELAEPRDGFQPIGVPIVLLFLGIAMFGGYYLGQYSGGWSFEMYDHLPAAAAPTPAEREPIDPLVLGKRIYATRCANCHQPDGEGQRPYPPIAGSEWVTGPADTPTRILLQGLVGPIEVRGELYDGGQMPAFGNLDDEDLAAVITYIRQAFGNSAGPVAPELVAAVREQTSGRTNSWTAEELLPLAGSVQAQAPAPDAVPDDGIGDPDNTDRGGLDANPDGPAGDS